jgi:hypothetical protein
MLLEIARVADAEIVDNPNAPLLGQQSVDEVAADKPPATRHNIQTRHHQIDAPGTAIWSKMPSAIYLTSAASQELTIPLIPKSIRQKSQYKNHSVTENHCP